MSVTSPGAGTVRLRPGRRAEAERARQRMVQGRSTPVKPLPEKKVFCKQNPEIPSLPPEDYKKDDYGDAYWATWPEPQWNNKQPWLSASAVEQIQAETGCVSDKEADQLLHDIIHGVELGCTGDARLPTDCPNNASAATHGERLLDMMATWCKSKICSGPFTRAQLEAELGPNVTINPIQVAEKPCGKVNTAVAAVLSFSPAGETHCGYVEPKV